MKIIINTIPEEGLNLQFHKDGNWFRDMLPEKEKSDFSIHGVEVFCAVKRILENVFIDGNLETSVTLNCCRCLEITHLPVKSNFRYTLIPDEDRLTEEEELIPEDLEYGYYQDDVIDLDALIFEQIVLQIPIRVLCTDTCKGFCLHCGTNLNMEGCNCHAEFIDERLVVLKKFKASDNK